MEQPGLDKTLEQIREALEKGQFDVAVAVLGEYHPADKAELFAELDEEHQEALFPELSPQESAEILQELTPAHAADLVSDLPDHRLVSIVERMQPDEAADLLGDIQPARAQVVLSGIEDSEDVEPLMLHHDESAGGLMTSDFLALRRRMTCQEAIAALRAWRPESETIYYLYVVDREDKLCGVVSLRELVIAQPTTQIMEIMHADIISVKGDMDQEEVARVLSHYDFLALPVVDSTGVLLGVVTVDDVIDVIEQEASEDIQRLGGAEPLDRSYLETSPFTLVRKRIGWLFLLFVTATLTGSVLRMFESQLQATVALIIFIPLLIGTGGNAGSQTTATVIRSLATGDITPGQIFRVWWHEAKVGLFLGLGMAVIAYVRAVTWDASPQLGLTVAVSTIGIVLWATGVGSLLPLLAARMGVDPALISGPVMSTLVDATGLLIYFTIAGMIMGM